MHEHLVLFRKLQNNIVVYSETPITQSLFSKAAYAPSTSPVVLGLLGEEEWPAGPAQPQKHPWLEDVG